MIYAVCRGPWAEFSMKCEVCSVKFAVCSVYCAVCIVQCVLCSFDDYFMKPLKLKFDNFLLLSVYNID